MKTTGKLGKALQLGGLIPLLTLTPVSHIAAQTCIQPPAGLISWWPGDGNAGDIQDGNDGSLNGNVTFVAGVVDQAFHFSGDGKVIIPDSANLQPTGQLTIDAWIKPVFSGRPASSSDADVILSKVSTSPGELDGYQLSLLMDPSFGFCGGTASLGTIQLAINIGGTLQCLLSSSTVPNDNQFHHVAGTFDGSVMKVYMDGALVGQKLVNGNIVPTNADALIGFRPVSPMFSRASIDEVEIFDRALSSTEIAAIYNAGSAGKCKEPDNDGDGVPNDEDECPNSDLSATVIIDGCSAGVLNSLFPSGCTISDLIAACAEGASSHGQFVSCVSDMTNDLKKAGTITGQQKGAIQSCAAQANIP